MPNYFLSMNSAWVEDLATLVGTAPYNAPMTKVEEMRMLAALYEQAIDRSNLRNDEFRSLFS